MGATEGEDGAGGGEAHGGEDDHARDDALGVRDTAGRPAETHDDRAHRLGERIDQWRALHRIQHPGRHLCDGVCDA